MKWFLEEEHSDRAADLLEDAFEGRIGLFVPPLFRGEVLNALYQHERRNRISTQAVDEAIERFSGAPFDVLQPAGFIPRALAVARQFSLGATYDAQYLVLAESLGAVLWSADEALIRATAPSFRWIRWIGDYTSPDDDA